jgi:hypothetical protein
MTDLEQRLADSLTAIGATDVHVESLLARTRAAGQRRRRRRRSGLAAGAALAMGLVTALILGGLSRLPAQHDRTVDPAATASASPPPTTTPRVAVTRSRPPYPLLLTNTLPNLPIVPGASVLTDPSEFDQPAHLHISFDKLPFPAIAVDLDHALGLEEYRISAKLLNGQQAHDMYVELARDETRMDRQVGTRSNTTVAGHPATLAVGTNGGTSRWTTLRWQPVPGLWAEIAGYVDAATARAAANAVRFDRTYRCTVPFRLTWLPPGARLFDCSEALNSGIYYDSSSTLQVGTGTVGIGTYWGTASPNTTLDGHPALVEEDTRSASPMSVIQMPLGNGQVEQLQNSGVDIAAVRQLAVSFEQVPGEDPAGWPDPPAA